jgi:hypothetical protein
MWLKSESESVWNLMRCTWSMTVRNKMPNAILYEILKCHYSYKKPYHYVTSIFSYGAMLLKFVPLSWCSTIPNAINRSGWKSFIHISCGLFMLLNLLFEHQENIVWALLLVTGCTQNCILFIASIGVNHSNNADTVSTSHGILTVSGFILVSLVGSSVICKNVQSEQPFSFKLLWTVLVHPLGTERINALLACRLSFRVTTFILGLGTHHTSTLIPLYITSYP